MHHVQARIQRFGKKPTLNLHIALRDIIIVGELDTKVSLPITHRNVSVKAARTVSPHPGPARMDAARTNPLPKPQPKLLPSLQQDSF